MKTLLVLFVSLLFMSCGEAEISQNYPDPTPDPETPVEPQQLAKPAPELFGSSLTMNGFTLTWGAVEGAAAYSYTLNEGEAVTTTETFVQFSELEPLTPYTFAIQALPANETTHTASEWARITITTEKDPDSEEEYPDDIPEPIIPEEYKLVWSDEFDGESLDTSKWYVEVNGNGGGNNELQFYDKRGVSVGKEPESNRNCLILTARKEVYRGKSCSSGRVNTSQSYNFTHGRVEALIRLPHTADGLWPAFWLLGSNYFEEGWPKCGELDIMEMGNSNGIRRGMQDRYFNGACHWGYYLEGGGYPNYAVASDAPYSLQDGFHLFTLIWDEGSVKTYLDLHLYPDNEPYFAMNINGYDDDLSPGHYFHHDFFIILNLAVGGNFTGIWDINEITALSEGEASMYVDYVRVYQK